MPFIILWHYVMTSAADVMTSAADKFAVHVESVPFKI